MKRQVFIISLACSVVVEESTVRACGTLDGVSPRRRLSACGLCGVKEHTVGARIQWASPQINSVCVWRHQSSSSSHCKWHSSAPSFSFRLTLRRSLPRHRGTVIRTLPAFARSHYILRTRLSRSLSSHCAIKPSHCERQTKIPTMHHCFPTALFFRHPLNRKEMER